jgi:hypothetical protein
MKCPQCGYADPFMPSWFDHEREVAEACYFKEWDPELFALLEVEKWVQVEEEFMYHMTRKGAIQRFRIVDLIAKRGQHIEYDAKASGRKNWHLKGMHWR